MSGAFEGLQVLELTWGMAGPMAGMMLADQGATVIRIEPPFDPFAGQAGYRVWNRGKKSVVLNLNDPEGRDAFFRLAARAEILLDSFRPGVTERLGIDHGAMSRLEAVGFCEAGQSKEFVKSGAIARGGSLPVNTNGGLIAEGYLHGMNLLTESVRQFVGLPSTRWRMPISWSCRLE